MRIGSPPQVRGKPDEVTAYQADTRITPAGAGKTLTLSLWATLIKDHPRRCGENRPLRGLRANALGSPPQVRGKPSWLSAMHLANRITPAGAGKTRCWKPSLTATQDHPRRCGENMTAAAQMLLRLGSPPQVRGKQHGKH